MGQKWLGQVAISTEVLEETKTGSKYRTRRMSIFSKVLIV